MLEVSKLKVKPPTLKSPASGVDGSKFQGTLKFAAVFLRYATEASTQLLAPWYYPMRVMASPVFRLPVSYCTWPEKLILPVIKVAEALLTKKAAS